MNLYHIEANIHDSDGFADSDLEQTFMWMIMSIVLRIPRMILQMSNEIFSQLK